MRKFYIITRLTAYACSLTALATLLYARSEHLTPAWQQRLRLASGVFFLVGFIGFLITYGLYVYSRLMKK